MRNVTLKILTGIHPKADASVYGCGAEVMIALQGIPGNGKPRTACLCPWQFVAWRKV